MKGYRTFIFGFILTLSPIIDYFAGGDLIKKLVSDPARAETLLSAIGVISIFLRAVTTSPMFQKAVEDSGIDTESQAKTAQEVTQVAQAVADSKDQITEVVNDLKKNQIDLNTITQASALVQKASDTINSVEKK